MSGTSQGNRDNTTTRRQLWRWLGWFSLANAGVFVLMSLASLDASADVETPIAWIYFISALVGNYVLLAFVPIFLLTGAVVLVAPRRRVAMGFAVLLVAAMIALLQLDNLLWSQSRFHLNALTVQILGYQSFVFVAVLFVVALVFESFLAGLIWRWMISGTSRRGWLAGAICGLCIVVSQGIHAWADASYYVPVTALSQQMPVRGGITAKSLLRRTGLVDPAASREREMARRVSREVDSPSDSSLNYPLGNLDCSNRPEMNLLIIMIDAMRDDMLNPEDAPGIYAFATSSATRFLHHFSGGNSSRMGVFSLFYSLPPGYWSGFEAFQRPPVLIDHLQSLGYQLGIFSSQSMYRPVMLDRTVFANVRALRMSSKPESDPAWKRDRTVNADWLAWLSARDAARPFFGFLFYDAVTAKSVPADYPVPLNPGEDAAEGESMARYRAAVHFDDRLVGEVLDSLRQQGLMDDTVIIITSDHGEEFDDSGLGLERHGSGFTRYQLQTPMVVAWPGRAGGREFAHRTSHYDVVPTLMQDLFQCSNPPGQYSVGNNLFAQESWDWILAGSYFNFAVLEPERVTITFPNGGVEVRNSSYQLIGKPHFDGEILQAVAEQNTRFYSR